MQDRVEGALNVTLRDSQPLSMPTSSERGWDFLGWREFPGSLSVFSARAGVQFPPNQTGTW